MCMRRADDGCPAWWAIQEGHGSAAMRQGTLHRADMAGLQARHARPILAAQQPILKGWKGQLLPLTAHAFIGRRVGRAGGVGTVQARVTHGAAGAAVVVRVQLSLAAAGQQGAQLAWLVGR